MKFYDDNQQDDWELRESVQSHCRETWSQLTNENLAQLTDYVQYKEEFLIETKRALDL